LDEHELAWAAGFFDGDGWAALMRQKGRRTGQPQARINQSSVDGVPEVLVRFRDAVGVGRIGGPIIKDRREPLYWWIASSRGDVTRTGELIGPWLSTQKRDQISAATALRFAAPPINSFAWAAGLFDAEGSTSLSDHRSHAGYKVIEAAITQGGKSVPEELVRAHALLERGNVNGPYTQEGANELIYRWRASRPDDVRMVLHLLDPWLGQIKRAQALAALRVIDAQPLLIRGRVEWGSHKTECVHGHEYASARLRPYATRSLNGTERRPSKQCLVCVRDQARARRSAKKTKIGDPGAADQHAQEGGDATC
jgi:hypothetical protein